MPLMQVNLDDRADCRRAIRLLRSHLESSCHKRSSKHASGNETSAAPERDSSQDKASLPLQKRLKIISQRGVWKHLVAIAKDDGGPKSLAEWDDHLSLSRNKMRSLKAIFAKLEKRFGLVFLRVAGEAAPDGNGNPRYLMPPRLRNKILAVAEMQSLSA